jgi:hypothetical protein
VGMSFVGAVCLADGKVLARQKSAPELSSGGCRVQLKGPEERERTALARLRSPSTDTTGRGFVRACGGA